MVRSLYWEPRPPPTVASRCWFFVPRTFCKSKKGSGYKAFALFCDVICCVVGSLCAASMVASQVPHGPVWRRAIFVCGSSPRRDAIAKNLEGVRRRSYSVCRRLALVWRRAILLSVPSPPRQRRHRTLAGDRCPPPGTLFLALSKRTNGDQILGDGVSLPPTTTAHKRPV